MNHTQSVVKRICVFAYIHPTSWLPILHVIVMLKAGDRLTTINREMEAWYNLSDRTLRFWRNMYQSSLRTAVDKFDQNFVDANNEMVVFDETIVGVHTAVGTQVTSNCSGRKTVRQQKHYIKKRLPG